MLSPSERQRLDAHVARCEACRLERMLRDDFADEMAADPTPSERLLLAGAQPRSAGPSAPPPGVPLAPPAEYRAGAVRARGGKRRAAVMAWLLVAAAVLGVSAAGATSAGQRAWSRLVGPPSAAPVEAAPPPAIVKHGPPHAPPLASAPLVAALPTADVLAAAPAAPARPAARSARAAEGASALFDAANDARRRGDYGRALQLQRELQARFPATREAHVARATTGRLLLDRGDPAGALADFDAYLARGSGELGEEAMVGRATALERLGRSAEASRAWQALLAAYPETPYGAHAKARLASSGVR